MRQKQPDIRYSDFEFMPSEQAQTVPDITANVDMVSTFIMLHGTSKWHDMRAQFARQRQPQQLPVAAEEIANMPDAQYEAKRQRIFDSQKTADKTKPVFATVEAPDLRSLGFEAHRLYKQTFGAKRYFEALGAEVSLDDKSYKKVVGNTSNTYGTTSNSAPAAESNTDWIK